MLRLFLLIITFLAALPASAQVAPRENAIRPELVLRSAAEPGRGADLAIHMRTRPGWHGYWLNPGDAGLPMAVEWQLPPGWRVEPLRYPVPQRLLVAGIVNYVYKGDYALLTRIVPPAGAPRAATIRANMRWLACTDEICVPERGTVALTVPTAGASAPDPRFDTWLRALPQPLSSPARFAVDGDIIRLGIPLPAAIDARDPYFFPAEDGPVDYAAEQRFTRKGDLLIAELKRGDQAAARLNGVVALGDGRGLELSAAPGDVPRPEPVPRLLIWALLGAIAGGLILNLMPCVFPILAVKAMHLARAGGDERHARRDALGYSLGAVAGTGALGVALLAIRAGGEAAGWAFQLQDPRSILVLLLLATAITLNLLRVFELPVIGGEASPAGSVGTGALAAFVATPCAGPFLGTALGAALLLPAWGAVLVFAALGLGLALPFLAIAFIPALRRRLPKPGPWMARLQRILAIPMALTVLALLWLLWRGAGRDGLLIGVLAAAMLAVALVAWGRAQRSGGQYGWKVALSLGMATAVALAAISRAPIERPASAYPAWSAAAVERARAAGKPVFVYFTADWCLSCKANEAGAIERDSTRAAFRKAGVVTLVGDWTDGDPVITRFLESRGRAGVPLYLWYEPGRDEPEELPQLLTPGMLSSRAARPR